MKDLRGEKIQVAEDVFNYSLAFALIKFLFQKAI